MKEKRNRKSKKTNQMKEIWRRFRKSKTAMLGLCLLIFVLSIAIFADDATCLPALSMVPAIRC